MEAKNSTYDEILRIGTELIHKRGFNATGLEAILTEAGVPKGSFYYYFKSKEEFGLAMIDAFTVKFLAFLDGILTAAPVPPLQRIRNLLQVLIDRMEQNACDKGCLFGNLGQEMASSNEKFRLRLEEVFLQWRQRLADCLKQAQQSGELADRTDPAKLAEFIVSGWEGAILHAKIVKSTQPMAAFRDILFERVLV